MITTETRRRQSTSNLPDSYWLPPARSAAQPEDSGLPDLGVPGPSASADSKPLDSAYGRWYASKKVGNRRIEACDGGVICSVNGASCQTTLGWAFIKGRDGLTPFDVFTAKDGTHCNLTLEQTKAKLLETGQTASLLNLNMFTEEILGLPANALKQFCEAKVLAVGPWTAEQATESSNATDSTEIKDILGNTDTNNETKPKEKSSMTTVQKTKQIVTAAFKQAAAVNAADALNRKILGFARDKLTSKYPETSEFLNSKLGEDFLTLALPTILHMAATEFSEQIPHADKVAKVTTYAIQGSVNKGVGDMMGLAVEFMGGLWGMLKDDKTVLQLLEEGESPITVETDSETPQEEEVNKTAPKRKSSPASPNP